MESWFCQRRPGNPGLPPAPTLLASIGWLGLQAPGVVADAALAPLLARLVRHDAGLPGEVVFLAEEPEGKTDPAIP